MKVLVLGGTGAIGEYLVQQLSIKSFETYVTSRRKRESLDNIHYIQGNAREIEFIQTVLSKKWDVIVDFMVYMNSEFKERVCLLLNATSQYIFLSSARVYADSKLPLDENSLRLLDVSSDKIFLHTDDYSLTKARQEDILKNSGYSNWTIIRPYITYSSNRLQLGVLEKEIWLYRALQRKTIVLPENLSEKVTTLTNGANVANGIVAIINKPDTLMKTFNIATSRSVTWQGVLDIYVSVLDKYLGEKPKVKLLDLNGFLQCRIDRYQLIYDRLLNRKFDNTQIDHFIDTKSFISPEDGLRKSLNEFLKNPHFENIDYSIMGAMDKQTGEKIQFSDIPTLKNKLYYAVCRFFPKRLIRYGLKIINLIF